MSDPHVLLTNDDGIDSPGLEAVYDALDAEMRVTVVAPAEDKSGIGRQHSYEVPVSEHELGYVVDGTPCDCALVGLRGLDERPDVLVAGANPGPNIGAFKLERSGTISAAIEAAFLGTPGIAISTYDRVYGGMTDFGYEDFAEAGRLARYFAREAVETDLFEATDALSINVPRTPPRPDGIRLTRPIADYDVDVTLDDGTARLYKGFYDPLRPDEPDGPVDPATDRGALSEEYTSVSPLTIDRTVSDPGPVSEAIEGYEGA